MAERLDSGESNAPRRLRGRGSVGCQRHRFAHRSTRDHVSIATMQQDWIEAGHFIVSDALAPEAASRALKLAALTPRRYGRVGGRAMKRVAEEPATEPEPGVAS